MRSRSYWHIFSASAVLAYAPAYATTYLTIEQAQAAIFPGAKLTASFIQLTDAQRRAIESRSGVKVREALLKAWRVDGGGWFFVDQVLGKHEFITYGVGLSPDGRVAGIEILEYRESYGYEVRNADWRRQFVGKSSADPLKLDADIRNISGATLSSKHIADGVRRLVATYEIALK
jgi:Na+-translocating ferredoxin:NAD+ oxidoreductase RnfG subunit